MITFFCQFEINFFLQVFPASIRSGASGISGGTGYAFAFLANKLFLKMLATLTLPGTFYFYSAVAFVGATILYFVLPETEGRSLTEIEEHFSGGLTLKQSSDDVENRSDATTVVAPPITARPKTDVVVGIASSGKIPSGMERDKNRMIPVDLKNWDRDHIVRRHIGDKNENLHDQAHHLHHHQYVQNPRAYVRHNNRGEDNHATVFSTHL